MKKLLIMNLALIAVFLSTEVANAQIIYSDNDYGCGWENYANAITRENSWEVGVNLLEYASGGASSVNMAQIIYSGDWNPDPSALPNLSGQYNSRTSNIMTYSNIDLATADLSNVDLLYITGHASSVGLSAAQKAALKDYLDNGGVLFADDCSNYLDNEGFETSFRNLITELYGSSLGVLASDHAIYSSYYALNGSDFSYTAAGNGTEWNQEPLEGYTVSITVTIDIKPGSFPNSINPNAGGVIPVAILSTDDFDASTVDPETVALNGEGARGKGKSGRYGSLEDVDGDGDLDLVVQIENEINWAENVTEATLTGKTWDGIPIQGTDTVNIVPPE